MRLLNWSRGILMTGLVASLLASASLAQPPGGGRGGGGGMRMGGGTARGSALELVNMEEVRKELKIDEAQVKELTSIRDELQGKVSELRPEMNFNPDMSDSEREEFTKKMEEFMAKVAEVGKGYEDKVFELLDPDQQGRLIGLMLQRGTSSLKNAHVAAAIGLNDEQLKQLNDIDKESQGSMRVMFGGGRGGRGGGGGGGGGGGAPGGFEAMQEAMKKADEKRLAVLNDEQKAKVESLKGAKFEFPERGFGGGGGRGQGGGGGRPGGGGGRPGGGGN